MNLVRLMTTTRGKVWVNPEQIICVTTTGTAGAGEACEVHLQGDCTFRVNEPPEIVVEQLTAVRPEIVLLAQKTKPTPVYPPGVR